MNMSFYISIFLIMAVFSFLEIFIRMSTSKKRLLEILALGIIIFCSSIRTGNVGDYLTYKETFEQIRNNFLYNYLHNNRHQFEIGYYFMNYVVKRIYDNYQFFIFVEALIANLVLYFASKNLFDVSKTSSTKDYTLTVFFIFYSLGLGNIIIARQTIAVMICLYSIRYIRNKSGVKFLIAVIIATLIHRTSCIWILSYFLYDLKTNRMTVRIKYLFCLLISVGILIYMIKEIGPYLPGVFGVKIRVYLDRGLKLLGLRYSNLFLIFKSSINILLLLFIFRFIFPRFKSEKMYVGLYNLYLSGAALMIATFFINSSFTRLATSYNMVSTFLLTYVFRYYTNRKENIIIFLIFSLYLFLRLFVYIHSISNLLIGYETIFGVL